MSKNYFLFLLLLTVSQVHSMTVGSDTAVTLFNSQVALANADRIAGFAALNSGFFLYNNATVLFDSFFSVSGNIALNGGTLNLNQDLVLQGTSVITSLGTINGNFYSLQLAPSITLIPTNNAEMGCAISIISTATALQPAGGVKVAWSTDSEYVLAGSAAGQMNIYEFNGVSLIPTGTGLDLFGSVNSMAWHPTNDWIAVGISTGGTAQLYIWAFSRSTATFDLLSSVVIGGNVHHVTWHPSGDFLAIGTAESTIRLAVYQVNSSGILGTSIIEDTGATTNGVDFNIDGTILAAVTNDQPAYELLIYSFNSTAFTLTPEASASQSVNAQVNSVFWNKITGNSTLLAAAAAETTGALRIYQYNSTTATLTLLAEALDATTANEFAWNQYSGCLAAALNTNTEGSGANVRVYSFSSTNNTLTETTDITWPVVNIYGGQWSPNGNYYASIDSGGSLRLYLFNPTLFTVTPIVSNLNLFLNNNVTFQDCLITFTGDNLINGNNNSLTLLSTTSFFLGTNASLLFQDVNLMGIQNGQLTAIDNTGTFSFQNCTWVLDGNFTFSLGSFEVLGGFTLQGKNTSFIYTSNQQSSILANGNMLIDSGVTFSYAPINNLNSLLQLATANSTLSLNSGTIITSSAGLQLTTGLLSIDGASYLINGGTSQAQGIIWGNGVSSRENLQLEWKPAATLQLVSGFLIDNNV